MSTTEKIKQWVIAELGRSAALKSATGSPGPVWAGGDDLPSRTGVYVLSGRLRRAERFADRSRVELLCLSTVSEQGAFAVMSAVRAVLDAVPGEPRAWQVAPATLGLRLNSVLLEEEHPPDEARIANQKTYWLGALIYDLRGKDASLP